MKPEALKLQRKIALKEVARFRADAHRHPMSDQRIANAVAPLVKTTPDQVLKWMREARG
ncbi:hypothetical protein [Sphingopyxis sp. 113P3]|uniref:hypothetical protein n=1 Tax=Sphingopyxis sp. (strain 113P3) TaxID=292913 RepID=UPI0006BD7AF3|nr:hypothetical protein [Sphingopyxis sp. 113P3]ALC12499.1 hypothetical protein LH20_11105 [Sphingopyxis sp. 113P3]